MIPLAESPQGVSFAVRVQPRARHNAITGTLGDALKISLTAPALEGRANDALIELLAELVHVPRGAITILSGQQSRNKAVCISGIARADLLTRLQVE